MWCRSLALSARERGHDARKTRASGAVPGGSSQSSGSACAAEETAKLGVLAVGMEGRQEGRRQMDQAAASAQKPERYAKNNDPSTWGTYAAGLAAFEAGKCDGIGFNLLGTDIAAFDIDDCRDPATGEIAPEAMAIVNRAASYTEMTASGTGLRVFGYGFGANVHRKQTMPGSAVEVESYRNAERYIVITGNPLPGTSTMAPHSRHRRRDRRRCGGTRRLQRRTPTRTTNSHSSAKPGMETLGILVMPSCRVI